jgi:hypothetical protein
MEGWHLTDRHDDEAERMERALETIDESKRDSLRKIVAGAVFVAPVVASFAINGLTVGSAFAVNRPNSTAS